MLEDLRVDHLRWPVARVPVDPEILATEPLHLGSALGLVLEWSVAMVSPLPFSRPYAPPNAAELVARVLASGSWSADGPLSKRAAAGISRICGGGACLLTTSCTHALE